MTWIDITLIVVWILFLVTGARLGSVWIAACVLGGFFGAFLIDVYAVPVASMMGPFRGATLLSSSLLFAGGLIPFLAVGSLLGRIASKLFLGLLNGLFGLLAGALAGIIMMAVVFLLLVPRFPSIERSQAWRKSAVAKPLQRIVEDIFNNPHFKPSDLTSRIKKEAAEEFKPLSDKAKAAVKDLSKTITQKM